MINIGKFNTLKVARKTDFGYYLDAGTGSTRDDVLLPDNSTAGKELSVGDEVKAFIYRDSRDRIIATLNEPLAQVGDIAYLKAVSKTKVGIFVSLGLEKDVLVPFKEQQYNLEINKSYLFYIYVDKTGRIAGTTDIDRYLINMDPEDETERDKYRIGDEVSGIVYGFQTNSSAMIAVDKTYRGVILNNEYFSELKEGDELNLRIIRIYEDGKLGLTSRKIPADERLSLEEQILDYLKNNDGFMVLNDKSSPDDIRKTFNESKNYFKNALGGLMKRGLIVQDEKGTRLK